jgi:uncharacterized ion transporter superfamily protein YfcC
MTTVVWILLAVAVAYGVVFVLRHRNKLETDKQASADKKAKSARHDAQAIQRTLDGRR